MADMPCCPDDSNGNGDRDTGATPGLEPTCERVPGNPIPSSAPDFPAVLLGADDHLAALRARAPPSVVLLPERQFDNAPPIYLITLRIRD